MIDSTLNETSRGNRLHIAILGRRNAGKSSLINALTKQSIALVSDIPGTTTDPVFKSMEILPIGPVVIIDTAGIDDEGELGVLRVTRSREVLNVADLAILLIDSSQEITEHDIEIAKLCRDKNLPFIVVLNKSDLNINLENIRKDCLEKIKKKPLELSALKEEGIHELKMEIIRLAPPIWDEQSIIGDLLKAGDLAILVTPIDSAAPKGRLILPQMQTLRDILDHGAMGLVVKEEELELAFKKLSTKPKIVITDSQAFDKVDALTDPDILLSSFSILFARYKGDLAVLSEGVLQLDSLKAGDKILIAEACTHHRVKDDIGSVKIPRWLEQKVGGELSFEYLSGPRFPQKLDEYKLIIHCGACMINRREMLSRIAQAQGSGTPIVNYGICIAYLMGILERALSPFPELQQKFIVNKLQKELINNVE